MKRLVPALLALLAGCGEPTIPEQLGIEVGDRVTLWFPDDSVGITNRVLELSGDWVKMGHSEDDASPTWTSLKLAKSVWIRTPRKGD